MEICNGFIEEFFSRFQGERKLHYYKFFKFLVLALVITIFFFVVYNNVVFNLGILYFSSSISALQEDPKWNINEIDRKNFPCDINFIGFFLKGPPEISQPLHFEKSLPPPEYLFVREFFDWRRLCGMESTARSNPFEKICFHHFGLHNATLAWLKVFYQDFPNIKFKPLDIDKLIDGLPFNKLQNGGWKKWMFPTRYSRRKTRADLSDVLRIALLKTNGRIYMDLDEAAVKPLKKYFRYENRGHDYLFHYCLHRGDRCNYTASNTPIVINQRNISSGFLSLYIEEVNKRIEKSFERVTPWAFYGADAMEEVFNRNKPSKITGLKIEDQKKAHFLTMKMRQYWKSPLEDGKLDSCPSYSTFKKKSYFTHFLSKVLYREIFEKLRKNCCLDLLLGEICPKSRVHFQQIIPTGDDSVEEFKVNNQR